MPTKFVSFDRLSRYTQKLKSYVGSQIQAAKTEWQKQLTFKVDKVTGKGLSTNDFTNEYKTKLDGIESGAQKNTVTGIKGNSERAYRTGNVNLTPANIGALEPSGDASNTKVSFTQSSGRANLTSGETLKTTLGKLSKWYADLKAVAFSGSYNDLSNKPTAFKNPQSLTIQQNGGSQTEYDGSTKLTVNITKAGIGLGNVENKSSATIRGELTSSNVITALGYTPINKSAIELTNQNLDAYYGTVSMGNMYYAGGGNSVTGKPSGVDNFWMWLVRTGDGVFSQLLTDKNSNLWVRYYNANSWNAWKQVVSSGMNISMLNNDKGYQTEQQVENKINEIVSGEIGQITTFSFQIVDSLPSTGTSNHIYLVPISGTKESDNYYEEYCYINNKWELIGTTQVDLTAYAKKTDIPTALKNPNAMTLQINGTSQGTYDGSTAKTYNVTKESLGLGNVENKSSATIRGEITASDIQDVGVIGVKGSSESAYRKGNVNLTKANIGLGNVENKSSATIRGELTLANVQDALGFDFDADQVISMCTHSKSGTVHTLVSKDGNTRYSLVRFVATADFTYGDTFRFGSASSPTVVTPKTEDGKLLTTGAFKKGSVVIAYTGDTTETVNTLFFKGGGGVDISGATATANDVVQGKLFFGKDGAATGMVPKYTSETANGAYVASNGTTVHFKPGFWGEYGKPASDPYVIFYSGNASASQVISGATFTSIAGVNIEGQIPDYGHEPLAKRVGRYNPGDGDRIYLYLQNSDTDTQSLGGRIERSICAPINDVINALPGGNRGNWGTTINPGGSVTIPQGYHSGGGVVRANGSTFGCERAGHCQANGYANGAGATGSSWVSAGHDTYSSWLNASVNGYFCVWGTPAGSAAPNYYWYGYASAGTRLITRGPNNTGIGMVTYIHS